MLQVVTCTYQWTDKNPCTREPYNGARGDRHYQTVNKRAESSEPTDPAIMWSL